MLNQTMAEIRAAIATSGDQITSKIIRDVIDGHKGDRERMIDLWMRYRIEPAASEELGPGVRILARQPRSDGDPNHRLNHAFERKIVKNKRGYLRGVTITTEQDDQRVRDGLEDWIRREHIQRKIGSTIAKAAVTGKAYWLLWWEDGMVRVRLCEPWETVVIRDEAGDVEHAFRYWDMSVVEGARETTRKRVEWYTGTLVRKYTETRNGFYELDDEASGPHLFDKVPVIEFRNDDDWMGHIRPVTRLIDAFDIAVSDLSSEVTALRLAYLVQEVREGFTATDVDEEFLKIMRTTGIMTGNWRFLEKNLQDEAIQNLITNLRHAIYEFADSYDPDSLAEGDPTAFEIAQKLKPLEDASTDTEEWFTEAIDQVIATAAPVWRAAGMSIDPSQVNQTWPRNIPRNRANEVQTIVEGGGRISNRTLLEGSSIVDDVDQEFERLAEEDAMAAPSVMDDDDEPEVFGA